jgi:hypothetical protein
MHAQAVTKNNPLLILLVLLLTLSFIPPIAKSADFTIGTHSTASGITGLFYNSSESGWGVNLVQQSSIIFATLFTYDTNGFPTWYVASNCVVEVNGCSGELYFVTAGSEITSKWNGANLSVSPVGNVSFSFTDRDNGTMTFKINGVSGSKVIQRQIWATQLTELKACVTAPTRDFKPSDATISMKNGAILNNYNGRTFSEESSYLMHTTSDGYWYAVLSPVHVYVIEVVQEPTSCFVPPLRTISEVSVTGSIVSLRLGDSKTYTADSNHCAGFEIGDSLYVSDFLTYTTFIRTLNLKSASWCDLYY